MKNIFQKTRNGLAGLALICFAGCEQIRLAKSGTVFLYEAVFKSGNSEQENPKHEEHFARKIYAGQSDATTFYFCDRGKIQVRYCGMPCGESFAISDDDGKQTFYSAKKGVIHFHGHKFEVLNFDSNSIELDHSVCPLTKD